VSGQPQSCAGSQCNYTRARSGAASEKRQQGCRSWHSWLAAINGALHSSPTHSHLALSIDNSANDHLTLSWNVPAMQTA
jgi:hypothetical protein